MLNAILASEDQRLVRALTYDDKSYNNFKTNMSNPQSYTHAAARLYNVLSAATDVPPGTATYRNGWMIAFGMKGPNDENALLLLFEKLAMVRELFDEVIEKLETVEALNESLYIKPVKEMRAVVSNLDVMDRSWSEVRSTLSSSKMQSFAYVMDLFDKTETFREHELPADELQKILLEVDKTFQAISKAKLPKKVRNAFLDIVEQLRRAVIEYKIRGNSGLQAALAKSTAVLVTNYDEVSKVKDGDQLAAIATLMKRVETALKVVQYSVAAYEVVTKAMPLLGSGSPN